LKDIKRGLPMLIRKATYDDLNAIWNIETNSFNEKRRLSYASLKHSLSTVKQDVFVAVLDDDIVGYSIIFHYKNSNRIYSIAIDQSYRNQGIGRALMNYMIESVRQNRILILSLEADATNISLIKFYDSFGFKVVRELKDYYGPDQPAFKMQLLLDPSVLVKKRTITNWVVTDLDLPWLKSIDNIKIIDADTYISDEKHQKMKGVRIFNLCSSYSYQSMGYYVSLLASARLQRVIPNVATIKDFSDQLIIESIGDEAHNQIQKTLKNIKSNQLSIVSYFGYTPVKKYQKLIKGLYQLFESPFLEFNFEKSLEWRMIKATPIAISDINTDVFIQEAAIQFFNQKRFNISRFKDYAYDLAILIDPDEVYPPSDKIALSKFKIAADKIGFFTEFITKNDYHRISEFDALFIRTTTNVNDYTYQFSRYAYAEGLVVIDDPWSILKCSNKLFFSESMKKNGIQVPKTLFVSKKTSLDSIVAELGFPMILKQPDSAFSLGVFKINDPKMLEEKLEFLFNISELIVAQAFIKSHFDWRIGVLDGKPIFACKYHMAKNHWQIINWNSKTKRERSGLVEAFRVEDVSQNIIECAVLASKAMGDGFYGVDIKVLNDQIYVIEVNDNPNVDYHMEDQILGDELYRKIIKTLYQRIEDSRNSKRKIA
jgi:glutathione synthase/RimK-type ligase-like ATP-grasp enzyme/ribosomal protein S18 acetylase RimI-like enzyme